MQLHITPSDGVPIYQQIVNQVKYLVASGRAQPGERLLPVRKLAEQLLVNPNTVARAYRELEGEGVIRTRQGSGAFIADQQSPLAHKEKRRILNERIDVLLTEARQMGVELDALWKLMQARARKIQFDREV